jgi:hypothetical protein
MKSGWPSETLLDVSGNLPMMELWYHFPAGRHSTIRDYRLTLGEYDDSQNAARAKRKITDANRKFSCSSSGEQEELSHEPRGSKKTAA